MSQPTPLRPDYALDCQHKQISRSQTEALKVFAPILSAHFPGSWQEAKDHEAQSFSQAMSQLPAIPK
jgi:hypothetical protein